MVITAVHFAARSGRRVGTLVIATALLSIAGSGAPAPVAAATPTPAPASVRSVCPAPGPGEAQCLALEAISGASPNAAGPSDAGLAYGPSDLRTAYNLPNGSEGTGLTVAVVDAYDWPAAEADLAAYRSHYSLPSCTTANGCFRRVNQRGVQGDYPEQDPHHGWGWETDLDIEMVSAACPHCRILLVEADDNMMNNLGASVNTAVALGAVAVSNSYGGPDDGASVAYDQAYYDHPGVAITASTGDCGWNCTGSYGPNQSPIKAVEYPASSPYVVAVGGTSLYPDSGSPRGWRETAWGNGPLSFTPNGGAGSGCSDYEPKPAWQKDSGCANRTEADVSAVADPATPVAIVYNSTWQQLGGTSASSPIIAAIFALAGGPAAGDYPAKYLYEHTSSLNDVVGGNNNVEGYAGCDDGNYLCTAVAGYDGPTGLGTPNGLNAFTPPVAAPTTYTPMTPSRILDTRIGKGLSGPLSATRPRTFQVAGKAGVPMTATAVTGNVTVTNPSAAWALYLGPLPTAAPASSTINFTAHQTRANGVTVQLSSTGSLSATYLSYAGNTTDLVFDVTGYFVPDAAGDTWHAIAPYRMLDTRTGAGFYGKLTPGHSRAVQITGRKTVPANARGITGNVTITNSTGGWAVYVGPVQADAPATSNVNFTAGETTSNNLSVALSSDGRLWVTFMGNSGDVDVVIDVTGYYTRDMTGLEFVPLNPVRLLDTRTGNGLSTKISSNLATPFTVAGRGRVPIDASAVSGNLTVVNQSDAWAVYLGPSSSATPGTSTINFTPGDVKANGVIVGLASGKLYATYLSYAGRTTDLVWDATGYFIAPPP